MQNENELYKCLDCDLIFDEPQDYTETYEAYGRPLIHHYLACPRCAGNFMELKENDESEA